MPRARVAGNTPVLASRPGIALATTTTPDQVARLIKHYHGNLGRVADKLGCARHTIRRYINKDEELVKLLADSRERFIDDLEECSRAKALHGDTAMQIFLLKCMGKERGYTFDEYRNSTQELAAAAFAFVSNHSKNPAERPPVLLEHDA